MAMADRHAALQANDRRSIRGQNRLADGTHRPRSDLPLPGTFGRPARVHQEDANHPGRRSALGTQTNEGVGQMSRKNIGSSVDDFLKEEGIFEETQALAIKEVVAWQLAQAMKKKKISKSKMASMLKTSRSQVDRLLDSKEDITLLSLQRAAAMVGKRVLVEIV